MGNSKSKDKNKNDTSKNNESKATLNERKTYVLTEYASDAAIAGWEDNVSPTTERIYHQNTISSAEKQSSQNDTRKTGILKHSNIPSNGSEHLLRIPGNGIAQTSVARENYIYKIMQKSRGEIGCVENASTTKASDSLNHHVPYTRHQFARLTRDSPLCNDTKCVHKTSHDQTTKHLENAKTAKNEKVCENNFSISREQFKPFKIENNPADIFKHDYLRERESMHPSGSMGNGIVPTPIVRKRYVHDTSTPEREISCVENTSSTMPLNNLDKLQTRHRSAVLSHDNLHCNDSVRVQKITTEKTTNSSPNIKTTRNICENNLTTSYGKFQPFKYDTIQSEKNIEIGSILPCRVSGNGMANTSFVRTNYMPDRIQNEISSAEIPSTSKTSDSLKCDADDTNYRFDGLSHDNPHQQYTSSISIIPTNKKTAEVKSFSIDAENEDCVSPFEQKHFPVKHDVISSPKEGNDVFSRSCGVPVDAHILDDRKIQNRSVDLKHIPVKHDVINVSTRAGKDVFSRSCSVPVDAHPLDDRKMQDRTVESETDRNVSNAGISNFNTNSGNPWEMSTYYEYIKDAAETIPEIKRNISTSSFESDDSRISSLGIDVDELDMGLHLTKRNWQSRSCYSDSRGSSSSKSGASDDSIEETFSQDDLSSNVDEIEEMSDASSENEDEIDIQIEDLWRTKIQELAQKVSDTSEDVSVSKIQIYVFKICAVIKLSEVSDCIQSRLPNNVKFELLESEQKKRNTFATLQFPSKRMALRSKSLLHQGNRKNRVKIWMVCEKIQPAGSVENRSDDNGFQQHLDDILKRADSTIYTHDQKIESVRMKLNEIKNEIEKKKFLKLLEFESYQKFTAERQALRQALRDQLTELQGQKAEFNIYMEQLAERLESIDTGVEWKTEIQDLKKFFGIECVRLRDALPIYARRSDIQMTIKENKVSVILGETGSGKSTQLPQYVYRQPWVGNGLIVCTQPRKVAAVSLATRVASEIATTVGQEVGYHVGMNLKKSASTKILYMTDHCLLNECLKDNALSAYSCIIIDEAHERSIFTDLLLGMIKRCLTKRDDLRIIVTSATIDPGVFQNFFNNCPVMKVSGRMFPVEVIWKEQVQGQEPFDDYENNAVQKAIDIHLNEPNGDVLVFLTSPLEAENCCKLFQNRLKDKTSVVCLQLHSKVQSSEQQLVFRATPVGKRKIVFATNSAETSITIPNIRYVVDTGLMKENQYDPVRNLNTLSVTMVTRSNAEQRKGRAGRTMAGKCYRLYTEHDFESMKPTNIPELLRINLGQAILKLFELGVNPFEFEFVQSPNRQSMDTTLNLLEDIGAIKQSSITELGKWISKLPVDPKFGAFIYQGLQDDIGPETIVIAAFVSATGSVFYRGGSQEKKDAADRIKTKFCQPGGDFLSYLNVFREWYKQPERGKSKWCVDNSVNGKTLKCVRETINEILLILRKENKKNVKLEFSKTSDKIEGSLIKLLFKTLKVNLAHYLGHQGAGYLHVEKGQYIHLHPSSCLLALGCNPEWMVFLKAMRTSRDYAMEVVPVSEDILNEAIEEGWITVDKEEAKSRRVKAIATFGVGSQVFWDFVGPRYTNLRELEQEFLKNINGSPGVIEADKSRGHVKVYAAEEFTDVANMLLREELEYILEKLRNEESEQRLSQHTDKIRAVIGQGASVQTLYMPDQYKTVDIFCSFRMIHNINDDIILDLFEQFGDIQNHWLRKMEKISNSSKMCFLGKVTFVELKSAAEAVKGTQYNDDIQARSPIRQNGNDLTGFKAVLSWCRRPSKGFGFVELLSSAHMDKAVWLTSVSVGGSTAHVQQSRKNDRELYVKNLTKIVNEDVLRQGIADALHINVFNDIGRVTVVRENVQTTKNDLKSYQRRLKGIITQFVKHGNFEVNLREPRPNDRVFVAYVRFSDPDDGARACREISYSVTLNGETIAMKADLSTSIYIHKNIYEKISYALEDFLEGEEENSSVQTKTKQLRNGNVVIDLHADNPDELASTNRVIQKLVRGHKLTFQHDQRSEILFTRNGREKLTPIMRKTNTFINIDNRVMEITIHGNSKNIDRAIREIQTYLTRLKSLSAKQVELKGEDKPIGVMKALLIKYGITLDKLRFETGLATVDLDHRNHRLRMTGTEKAIETGCSMINDVISSVTINSSLLQNVDDPECAICLTSVDDYDQMYRLECCGHSYHKECIELQLTSAVKNKDFPVKCSLMDCENLFVWKDILNMVRFGFISVSDLVASSVSSFVSKNSEKYQYCVTPDCPIVYKIDKKGKCFRCPDCQLRICTSCKVQFHDGMTCTIYKGETGDKSIARWIRQDPDRRKLCPKCSMPIEKVSGCNRLKCLSCRKHICWVCMMFFDKSQKCYAHLAKVHGSFA